MATSLGYTRIRQLPEAVELRPDDLLVIENDLDTWHIKAQVFNDYIDGYIDSFKSDINDIIDAKFNEVQLLINQVEELVLSVDKKVEEWTLNEEGRIEGEKQRETAEELRQKIFDDMTGQYSGWTQDMADYASAEEQRKKNETARQEAEAGRDSAESQRNQNETERQTAETNRGVAETARENAESQRNNNESQRQTNENDRVTSFNKMVTYFNALEDSINNFGKSGISQATSTGKVIVPILEVSLPSDDINDYESLIYIREGNTDIEGFIGFTTHVEMANTSVTAAKAYINIPDRFSSNMVVDNFSSSYRTEDGRIIITLEYRSHTVGAKIKTGIIWDNISMYRSDIKPIYSLALRNEAPIASFTSSYIMEMSDDKTYGSPQGFITILNNISTEMQEIVNAIKPFKMFPVGSIYQTTSTKNPSELLGGGTWELLYGDGVSEGILIDGVEQYAPVIYTWERTN